MFILIDFLEGLDVFRTWIHRNELYSFHAILLIEMRRELHYFSETLSPRTKISPTHPCWRGTSSLGPSKAGPHPPQEFFLSPSPAQWQRLSNFAYSRSRYLLSHPSKMRRQDQWCPPGLGLALPRRGSEFSRR